MPHGSFGVPYANLSAWLVLLFWVVVILIVTRVRKSREGTGETDGNSSGCSSAWQNAGFGESEVGCSESPHPDEGERSRVQIPPGVCPVAQPG